MRFFLFLFFTVLVPIFAQENPPFWDLSRIDLRLKFSSVENLRLCLVSSSIFPKSPPNRSECIAFSSKSFSGSAKYFLEKNSNLSELSFSFFSESGKFFSLALNIGGLDYKLRSILFFRKENIYFAELSGEKEKYFLFTIDPEKLSFGED